jgi:cytochrome c oxidase assembly protein subunit 15
MTAGALLRARVRGLSPSAATVHRVTVASAVMLVVIIATGATVRLTGSGLGCEHWPGCTPHHFEPRSFHSDIEFGNRAVALLTILATLAAWIVARGHRRLAFATFFGTLLQAPLGAITIHYGLNPWLVLTHFLLSAVVLALGVILVLETRPRQRSVRPAWVPALGLLVAASAAVLLFSGTFATASGPHPGATVVRRLWSFQPAVYWHVRATAVFGLSFLLLLFWLVRNRAPQARAAFVVLGLLLAQMAVGETQYRTQLPWWLVLVHVTLAASVWAAVTALVYSLWRPRRMA